MTESVKPVDSGIIIWVSAHPSDCPQIRDRAMPTCPVQPSPIGIMKGAVEDFCFAMAMISILVFICLRQTIIANVSIMRRGFYDDCRSIPRKESQSCMRIFRPMYRKRGNRTIIPLFVRLAVATRLLSIQSSKLTISDRTVYIVIRNAIFFATAHFNQRKVFPNLILASNQTFKRLWHHH